MDSSSADGASTSWMFDEMASVGVEYNDPAIVAEYDQHHATFRDHKAEARVVMERLGLTPEYCVVDIGCGTGAFTLNFATNCRHIHAVDVSRPMLDRLTEKAQASGLDNIEIHHAGFLGYQHADAPADAVFSSFALHHLPDFWKAVALQRIHEMLKPGGAFYLFDVVFTFPVSDYRAQFDNWIDGMENHANAVMTEEVATHIRDEYSTLDWILEGMMERTGFNIESKHVDAPNCIAYVCVKP